jgi:hypothetical protein
MARRQRLTWKKKEAEQASPPQEKQASPPPQTPSEAGDHPGTQPDPGMDDYKTGDPSTWMEDPRPGPYPNSPMPQMPTETDTGERHVVEAHLVRRASKCLDLAEAMLGKEASEDDVMAQGLEIMFWDDPVINQSMERLQRSAGEKPKRERRRPSRTRRARTDKPSRRRSKNRRSARDVAERRRRIEKRLAAKGDDKPERTRRPNRREAGDPHERMLQKMLREEKKGRRTARKPKAEKDPEEALDRMLLASMLKEEGLEKEAMYYGLDEDDMGMSMGQDLDGDGIDQNQPDHMAMDSEEALLAQMMEEEGMEASMCGGCRQAADEDDEKKDDEKKDDDEGDDEGTGKEATELDIVMDPLEDPMDLSGENHKLAEDDRVLASLFMPTASDDDDDNDDDDDDNGDDDNGDDDNGDDDNGKEGKKAGRTRTASLRPKARKPSHGVRSLGGAVSAPANRGTDDVLSGLWETKPNIEDAFE